VLTLFPYLFSISLFQHEQRMVGLCAEGNYLLCHVFLQRLPCTSCSGVISKSFRFHLFESKRRGMLDTVTKPKNAHKFMKIHFKRSNSSYMFRPLMWPCSGRCITKSKYIEILQNLCEAVHLCALFRISGNVTRFSPSTSLFSCQCHCTQGCEVGTQKLRLRLLDF
jgi:hypothetical protein